MHAKSKSFNTSNEAAKNVILDYIVGRLRTALTHDNLRKLIYMDQAIHIPITRYHFANVFVENPPKDAVGDDYFDIFNIEFAKLTLHQRSPYGNIQDREWKMILNKSNKYISSVTRCACKPIGLAFDRLDDVYNSALRSINDDVLRYLVRKSAVCDHLASEPELRIHIGVLDEEISIPHWTSVIDEIRQLTKIHIPPEMFAFLQLNTAEGLNMATKEHLDMIFIQRGSGYTVCDINQFSDTFGSALFGEKWDFRQPWNFIK